MKILAKLLIGFISVAVLCGIVGVVGITQLVGAAKNLTDVRDDTIPSILAIQEIESQLNAIKAAIRSMAIDQGADDAAYIKRQKDNIEKARAKYAEAVQQYEALQKVPEEDRLWRTAQKAMDTARAYNNEMIDLADKAIAAGAGYDRDVLYSQMFNILSGDRRAEFDGAINAILALADFVNDWYGVKVIKKATDAAAMSETLLIVVTILSFLVAIALGLILGRSISNPLKKSAGVLNKMAAGDLSERFKVRSKDEFAMVSASLNQVADALSLLISDAGMLVQAAEEGRLQTRADAAKHQGDYRKIVDGVNRTLDLVITPINETSGVLKRMAEGDLTGRITSEYKGDFDVLKTSLNESLSSMNDILVQVNTAVDQVAEGSGQVSQASQSLSQGATEQASSLEQITSSITELSSQTKANTENAVQVNGLATKAKANAEKGNEQMKDLVTAMSAINTSAEEIKKVTKAIDDISFQINLLALNANVEAARAGKYGKGFAVVAEEVRNLAVRSANSVKETTRMVDEAIANIERGNDLVVVTAQQLAEIVGGAGQVANLAEEVSKASKEQSLGLEQISQGLGQIDQVTQANTASAEESASASEELSSQSQQVKTMLSRFKVSARESKLTDADMIRLLRAELARQQQGVGGRPAPARGKPASGHAPDSKNPVRRINPAEVISLDDDDFGKF